MGHSEKVVEVHNIARIIGRLVLALVLSFAFTSAIDCSKTAAAGETKLPADGGAPGKDYMTYVNALHKKDGAMIRKMAEVGPVSDKDMESQMDMMAAMTPTDQKIVSATINGDKANLSVTGMQDGKKQYGKIEMQKKGSIWKITSEAWSESPKK